VDAIVLADSPAACIRCASAAFFLIKRLGSSDVLPACPTCLPCRYSAFAAEFQLYFCQARKHSGNHSARYVRSVDPFAQRPEHDLAITHRRHHFGGVAAQPIYSDNNDCVSGPSIVK
jgi:hypothetical protein